MESSTGKYGRLFSLHFCPSLMKVLFSLCKPCMCLITFIPRCFIFIAAIGNGIIHNMDKHGIHPYYTPTGCFFIHDKSYSHLQINFLIVYEFFTLLTRAFQAFSYILCKWWQCFLHFWTLQVFSSCLIGILSLQQQCSWGHLHTDLLARDGSAFRVFSLSTAAIGMR